MAKRVLCVKCGEIKARGAKGMCSTCYHRDLRESRELQERQYPELEDVVRATAGVGPIMVINFDRCPEIFEKIVETAENQERSPEQQARFILRKVFGPGCGMAKSLLNGGIALSADDADRAWT